MHLVMITQQYSPEKIKFTPRNFQEVAKKQCPFSNLTEELASIGREVTDIENFLSCTAKKT